MLNKNCSKEASTQNEIMDYTFTQKCYILQNKTFLLFRDMRQNLISNASG